MLERDVYTPAELAELWRCNVSIIYEMLRDGRLQGFKLGRDWRIREEAILAYEANPDNHLALTYKPRTRANAHAIDRPLRVV